MREKKGWYELKVMFTFKFNNFLMIILNIHNYYINKKIKVTCDFEKENKNLTFKNKKFQSLNKNNYLLK